MRYEDLLKDPKQILGSIAEKYGIKMNAAFNQLENDRLVGKFPTKEGAPGPSKNIRGNYLKKYLEDNSYLEDFSDQDIEFISDILNFSLEN